MNECGQCSTYPNRATGKFRHEPREMLYPDLLPVRPLSSVVKGPPRKLLLVGLAEKFGEGGGLPLCLEPGISEDTSRPRDNCPCPNGSGASKAHARLGLSREASSFPAALALILTFYNRGNNDNNVSPSREIFVNRSQTLESILDA